MKPYFDDSRVRLFVGDALTTLREMPDESVQCCVTSPPYWGLRDYGTAAWDGGEAECNHVEMATGMSEKNTLGPNGYLPQTNAANVGRQRQYRDTCGNCGATRTDSQLGLESTPDGYVAALVEVFREVRRVLRDDGTVWLNLGDSYAATTKTTGRADGGMSCNEGRPKGGTGRIGEASQRRTFKIEHGLKPKDLVGIPWRVAFALQSDGWWLRQDIIWHKPNPMPESVTDRCTKAHEYIFLLSKSARYFYDAGAVKEVGKDWSTGGPGTGIENTAKRYGVDNGGNAGLSALAGKYRDGTQQLTRNRRSVWTITTKPYLEAHFATFPPELPELCIKAGSAAGDTILDPFAGAGTTLYVAKELGRKAVGIELNPDYALLIERRCAQGVLAL